MLLGNVEFSLRIGGLRAKPSSQCDATPNFTMLLTRNGNKQMGLMQTVLSTVCVSPLQEHCVEDVNSIKKGWCVQACCQSKGWPDINL